MVVNSPVQITSLQQLMQGFQGSFPQYKYSIRGKSLLIGRSTVVGLHITPQGPTRFKLGWAIPTMGVQMLLNLGFVAGILPGLLGYLITWLVVSNAVAKLQMQVRVFLESGGREVVSIDAPGSPSAAQTRPSFDVGAFVAKLKGPVGLVVAGVFVGLLALGGVALTYNEYDRIGFYREMAADSRKWAKSDAYSKSEQARQRGLAEEREAKADSLVISSIAYGLVTLVLFAASGGLFVGAVFLKARAGKKAQTQPSQPSASPAQPPQAQPASSSPAQQAYAPPQQQTYPQQPQQQVYPQQPQQQVYPQQPQQRVYPQQPTKR